MSGGPTAPRVLGVILSWRSHPAATRCADSLAASRGVPLDFVIVDNGSEDGSAAILRARFGEGRVLALPENTGYVGGMNAGIEHWLEGSDAPYALLLTRDMTLAPDAVREMVRAADAAPGAGIVGPVLYYRDQPERVFSGGGALEIRRARAPQLRAVREPRDYEVEWVDGCCMLLRREALQQTGGLDPRFFIYFEEVDLCHRVRQAGWTVLVATAAAAWQEKDAVPWHGYFHYTNRNRYLFFHKNFGLSTGRVAALVARDSVAIWVWFARALLVPALWPEIPVRWRWAVRQMRGAVTGSLAHVLGRYGP